MSKVRLVTVLRNVVVQSMQNCLALPSVHHCQRADTNVLQSVKRSGGSLSTHATCLAQAVYGTVVSCDSGVRSGGSGRKRHRLRNAERRWALLQQGRSCLRRNSVMSGVMSLHGRKLLHWS